MTHKFLSPPSFTLLYTVVCLKSRCPKAWLPVLEHVVFWCSPSIQVLIALFPSLFLTHQQVLSALLPIHPKLSPPLSPWPLSSSQASLSFPAFLRKFVNWYPCMLVSLQFVFCDTGRTLFRMQLNWMSFNGVSLLLGWGPQSVRDHRDLASLHR